MPDRLERLTNLVAALLATRRPLTLEEIVARVPGYPDGKTAYRRQFERDKDTLRGIGVPLTLEPLHPLDSDVGYRVRPEDYYLPDLGLSPTERLALHAAVGAVRLEGGEGREALWKLGGLEGPADPEGPALAALTSVPWLTEIFDAYRGRARVSFSYRAEGRQVDPHGILFRHGHWYLLGHDHRRGEARSFRLDRIEGAVAVGPPDSFEAPTGFDPAEALRFEPWRFGTETPVEARVLVDARLAAWASSELGDEAIADRREDGSVVVSLSVTNRQAFQSFVLGLLDAATVLGPPALLADHLGWLEAIAERSPAMGAVARANELPRRTIPPAPERGPAGTEGPGRRSRADAAGRLRRLLAIIPWIVEHQGSSLEEIAARFGLEVRQLERDLELVPFCGLPPYTPDRLIDLAIVDGVVTVRFAEYLAAPLRLTAAEGFALLAGGRGLLAIPGSDPEGALAGALRKLGRVLGESGGIAIDLDPARFLNPLRDAAAACERVELEYYSFGRDAQTRRVVDPYRIFATSGQWYLEGYCHLAGDERLFRIDRIGALERREELFEPPPSRRRPSGTCAAGEVYRPHPLDPRVTLALPPAARWVVESYPTEEAEVLADGSLRVVLAVSERGWLERLLLRVGPEASVLSPPELVGVAQRAAARLLGRYERRAPGEAREDGVS